MSEPLRSDWSVDSPRSSATSPALRVKVRVPPADVGMMPPPPATDPVLETFTSTFVLSATAVMVVVAPSIPFKPPCPVTR